MDDEDNDDEDEDDKEEEEGAQSRSSRSGCRLALDSKSSLDDEEGEEADTTGRRRCRRLRPFNEPRRGFKEADGVVVEAEVDEDAAAALEWDLPPLPPDEEVAAAADDAASSRWAPALWTSEKASADGGTTPPFRRRRVHAAAAAAPAGESRDRRTMMIER